MSRIIYHKQADLKITPVTPQSSSPLGEPRCPSMAKGRISRCHKSSKCIAKRQFTCCFSDILTFIIALSSSKYTLEVFYNKVVSEKAMHLLHFNIWRYVLLPWYPGPPPMAGTRSMGFHLAMPGRYPGPQDFTAADDHPRNCIFD